jgi:uncharacterized RDD family membrane protein YckC
MIYSVKCHKCGLMQMPEPTCKACGAVLEIPTEAALRTSSMSTPSPLSKASSEAPSIIPSEAPPIVPSEPPSNYQTSMRTSRCSECGRVLNEDELIRFGNALVCAECKPLFVQKLREGVVPAGEMIFAGFWIRVGAKIIDIIILWVLGFVVLFLGGFLIAGSSSSGSQIPIRFISGNIFITILSWVIQIGYPTYFLGKYSATLGKMACGLKVVRPDGEKISYARACGRTFAEGISFIILCIGYILVAFDEERRALHDRICDTRVIRA